MTGALAALAFLVLSYPRGGSATPTPSATTAPLGSPTDLPVTAPTPSPLPEPTAEPAEYVRVANTGGQGVVLRREPSVSAERVVARAENTVLRIVGADARAENRVWRHVEDRQGVRGWVPAEFLVAAPPPSG